MAVHGQINKYCDEIKNIIVNGVDSSFDQVDAGITPAYGGTDDGEDFEGFSVYCTNLDDDEDVSYILDKPYIYFSVEGVPQEFFMDDNSSYLVSADFEIVIDGEDTKTISGDIIKKKELISWYAEQLSYLLSHANLTSIKEIDGRTSTELTPTKVKSEESEAYVGGINLQTVIYRE